MTGAGRLVAGEHFYGPKGLGAVDVPPGLGMLCVVSCRRRDGSAADLAVVDQEPAGAWRRVGGEGQRRAWREACDGQVLVWYRLYGPEPEAAAAHRELAAAIRSRLAERGR